MSGPESVVMDATTIGGIVAALLTLMVFSYLLGANPLWRIAQSLLVGVSVGYITLVLLTQVIAPQVARVIVPPSSAAPGDRWWALVPLVLGVLLLIRIVYPAAWPSSFALNLVVVVGSALALGGALAGTIVPQTLDSMRLLPLDRPYDLVGNVILVLGVIAALAYFAFGARPNGTKIAPVAALSVAGRWVLVVTFGAILGSLATTFYASLIERLQFLLGQIGF